MSNRDTNRAPELLLCGLQVIDTAALTTDVLSPMPHVDSSVGGVVKARGLRTLLDTSIHVAIRGCAWGVVVV